MSSIEFTVLAFFTLPAIVTFLVYPLVMICVDVLKKPTATPVRLVPCSVICVVRNESRVVERRIRNLLRQNPKSIVAEILIVDDGSTDDTAAVVQQWCGRDSRVRLLRQNAAGKAAGVNLAVLACRCDVIFLCDVRQVLAAGAVANLVAELYARDCEVIGGDLRYLSERQPWYRQKPLIWYWRIERRIRQAEAVLGVVCTQSGAIYCIRKDWMPVLPTDLILDDVYVPICVQLAGGRAGTTRSAVAWDTATSLPGAERRRKTRTLAGNFQLFDYVPNLLRFWHKTFLVAFFCHKFLRLVAPLGLVVAAIVAASIYWGLAMAVGLLVLSVACVLGLGRIASSPKQLVPAWMRGITDIADVIIGLFSAYWYALSGQYQHLWKKRGGSA